MNNSIESKVLSTMDYLARANSDLAKDYLSEYEVNYWLDNYPVTLFCSGTPRKVIFTPITTTRYEVRTERV